MIAALALALAFVQAAPPQEQVVNQALHDKGIEYLASGDFSEAAVLFAELYARTRDPWHLYNQGQAERLSGDCDAAIITYRALLVAEEADDRDRFHAAKNIERCGGEPTVEPTPSAPTAQSLHPTPQSPPPQVETRPVVVPTAASQPTQATTPPPNPRIPAAPDDDQTRRDNKRRPNIAADTTGWALAGTGLLSVAAGVPLYVHGNRRATSGAGQGDTEAQHVTRVKNGRQRRFAGTALIATGSVLVTAAVTRFVWLAVKSRRPHGHLARGRF